MTLEISAEKRRLASLTMGWFSARSCALPAAAARFFFGVAEAAVPGRRESLRFGCEARRAAVRMRLASALNIAARVCFENVVWMLSVSPVRVRVASWIASEADCWPLTAARAATRDCWRVSRSRLVGETSAGRSSGAGVGSGARAREPSVVEKVEAVVVGRTASGFFDSLRSLRMMESFGAVDEAVEEEDTIVVVLNPPCPAAPVEGGAPGIVVADEVVVPIRPDCVGEDGAPGVVAPDEDRLVGVVEGVGGDWVAPSWVRRSSTGRRRWRWTSLRTPSSRWKRGSWRKPRSSKVRRRIERKRESSSSVKSAAERAARERSSGEI